MKFYPLPMSGPSVTKTLAGQKSQVRRLVDLREFQPSDTQGYDWTWRGRRGCWQDVSTQQLLEQHCPYGPVGSRLWVRETWAYDPDWEGPGVTHYRATHPEGAMVQGGKWRPSIHMPRWASRITLEVTELRVQRLNEISEEDARAEGMDWASPLILPGERVNEDDREDPREVGYSSGSFALQNFRKLWDHSNGSKAPWANNPWVWAITFRRVQ